MAGNSREAIANSDDMVSRSDCGSVRAAFGKEASLELRSAALLPAKLRDFPGADASIFLIGSGKITASQRVSATMDYSRRGQLSAQAAVSNSVTMIHGTLSLKILCVTDAVRDNRLTPRCSQVD